jgi:hypothetical protein
MNTNNKVVINAYVLDIGDNYKVLPIHLIYLFKSKPMATFC